MFPLLFLLPDSLCFGLMARDYYDILGVDRGAPLADIKKAYRGLSKKLHPDKNKDDKDAEQSFKEVNEAYEVLSDEKKRNQYDQFGSVGGGAGGPGGFDFSGFQGGGLGDIFETFFGGGAGARAARSERGRDQEVHLTIDFTEVVSGVRKKIAIDSIIACEACEGRGAAHGSKLISCSECSGTGQVTRTAQSFFGIIQQSMVCPRCKGSGKVPEETCKKCGGEGRVSGKQQLTIDIPAGIHDGQTLRLTGKGAAGRQGATAGDLYLLVSIRPDSRFQRDGDDIRAQVNVSVLDAILGTEIKVPTVHGNISLKIPAGTQPHQVFRIKGKGMPVLSSSRHGDHYVTVEVEIPKKLSRKEKELLEEWKRTKGEG